MRSYGLWNCAWTILCYILQTGFSLGSSLWLSAWSNDALDPDKALDPHLRDVRLGVYGGLGGGESELVLMFSLILLQMRFLLKLLLKGALQQNSFHSEL